MSQPRLVRHSRRIVQIAVGSSSIDEDDTVYALASDGTLWRMGIDGAWHELPALPDEEYEMAE